MFVRLSAIFSGPARPSRSGIQYFESRVRTNILTCFKRAHVPDWSSMRFKGDRFQLSTTTRSWDTYESPSLRCYLRNCAPEQQRDSDFRVQRLKCCTDRLETCTCSRLLIKTRRMRLTSALSDSVFHRYCFNLFSVTYSLFDFFWYFVK